MIKDVQKIHGIFRLRIFKSGKLIEAIVDDNMVVSSGNSLSAHLLAGASTPITKIGVGTSIITPTKNDITLVNPQYKNIASYDFPSPGQVNFDWVITETDFNGMTINEFGLLTSGNTLFARKVRTQSIQKTADISLSGTWTIVFE